ncbi:MAG: hypothetical protein A3C88_00510 [Candidatus Yanofskybacteria bacterium RIFCSPHIGHO2_02_FULL_50_12]|uniref:Transglycosylase SLT domain-containing protein n=1 Tax=Candidatus Yanofskybacteria bacterium RIFCSPHIGHO2_02_FULL_50_12 TaxID=1802685 RepID=A0A1F8FUR9_9BACT|nr:MAG: hypothetical protein A3C88_00510 [Candidatus Yanofskybacteria bacterium RIFCSPHIGHO2_02_FULL_50_12]
MKLGKKIAPLIILVCIFLPSFVQAAPWWWPIVPCGLQQQPADATAVDIGPNGSAVPHDYTQDCNKCLLILLFKNIVDMTFFVVVPVLGTALFIWAGFLILIGARQGKGTQVSEGLKIFNATFIGALVLLSSWLLTNFVLKSLVGDDGGNQWYQLQCSTGSLADAVNVTVPQPGTSPQVTQAPPGSGMQCRFSGVNLCQAAQMTCSNSSCAQYVSSIGIHASRFGVEPNLVKAIMMKESSCRAQAGNAGGNSWGLMALQPATANQYRQFCGVNQPVNSAWLTNPQNSDKVICIGTKYLSAIKGGVCGSEIRNIAAGYNGGPGACRASVSCSNETSCSSMATRKWECLYDNPQKTRCNTGYDETRDYAPKVLYCYNNPGF